MFRVYLLGVRLVYTSSFYRPPLNAMLRVAIPIVLPVLLSACGQSQMFGRSSDSDGYWLPLSVDLRLDSTITEAGVPYTDACRQPQTLPIGDRLRDALKREIGSVFERVTITPAQAPPSSDGVVDVMLGLKEMDLFIPRQATKSYSATVRLGASVAYTDSKSAVLYTKHVRTEARGTVEIDTQRCDVQGLPAIAGQAVTALAQGLKKYLGTSTKVRDAALATTEKGHQTASSGSGSSATLGVSPAATPSNPAGEIALTFRVMLKDENQDGVVHGGEAISLEIEVMNGGNHAVNDVMLSLDGTSALVEQFANVDPIGTVQPGEMKRRTLQGTAPDMERLTEAELIVSLESPSLAGLPNQKKFQVALKPRPPAVETVDDVDRIPERVPGYLRQKAVGIAVGIGAFRKSDVPVVQFAARDAEVMVEYFRTVSGIPASQVRLATDDHALKDDLVDIFEGWLPEQTVQGGTVFIFFAGRGIVNPANGAVSLISYEADPTSATRVYSLRRLYEALARLPIQRAVLLMDLTFDASLSDGASNGKRPIWDAVPPALRKDKLLQVIGVNGVQEAHQYEGGRHGLFTYFVLKGLGGAADADDNGIVAIGELCGYVREQVAQVAKKQFNNAQEPACVPALGMKSKASQLALGRVK